MAGKGNNMCDQETKNVLDKMKQELIEKTYQIVNTAINEAPLHKTAPETDKRLTMLENKLDKLTNVIEENTREVKKVQPVLQAWTTLINTKKGLTFLAGLIGAISIIIVAIYKIKHWIKH